MHVGLRGTGCHLPLPKTESSAPSLVAAPRAFHACCGAVEEKRASSAIRELALTLSSLLVARARLESLASVEIMASFLLNAVNLLVSGVSCPGTPSLPAPRCMPESAGCGFEGTVLDLSASREVLTNVADAIAQLPAPEVNPAPSALDASHPAPLNLTLGMQPIAPTFARSQGRRSLTRCSLSSSSCAAITSPASRLMHRRSTLSSSLSSLVFA